MSASDCDFCDLDRLRSNATIVVENGLCRFVNSDAGENGALVGSGIIIPKRHRPTMFESTADELAATFTLLHEVRPILYERYRPDGFTVGWNCYAASGQTVMHAHLLVLLRFLDEPAAGHGLRWHLKQPSNARLDPSALGRGLAVTS